MNSHMLLLVFFFFPFQLKAVCQNGKQYATTFTWKTNLHEQYWCWWMLIISFDLIASRSTLLKYFSMLFLCISLLSSENCPKSLLAISKWYLLQSLDEKKKETFDDNNCSFISNKSKNETKNRMKFMALANIFTHIDVIIKYIHSFRIGWILNYFWSSVVRMRKNATIKEYCYLLMNKIWSMTIWKVAITTRGEDHHF